MFKVIEKVVIEIGGKEKCWYCSKHGRRELKMKIDALLKRGLTEL